MSTAPYRPTRREERRTQTVQEIKALAMQQITAGGPDAVSLSGIVREMAMSPAAIYRYFENRDALLADLVVDAYDDFADSLVGIPRGRRSAADHLGAVLSGVRSWALSNPNAYLLIFQTSLGSGRDFAVERTVPAASRSMTALVTALAEVGTAAIDGGAMAAEADRTARTQPLAEQIETWSERSGLTDFAPAILLLALRSWTRLHGVISLELGGHLTAVGIDPALLYQVEVTAIVHEAEKPDRLR
jgi:AcrR family transcriptional regulator